MSTIKNKIDSNVERIEKLENEIANGLNTLVVDFNSGTSMELDITPKDISIDKIVKIDVMVVYTNTNGTANFINNGFCLKPNTFLTKKDFETPTSFSNGGMFFKLNNNKLDVRNGSSNVGKDVKWTVIYTYSN